MFSIEDLHLVVTSSVGDDFWLQGEILNWKKIKQKNQGNFNDGDIEHDDENRWWFFEYVFW